MKELRRAISAFSEDLSQLEALPVEIKQLQRKIAAPSSAGREWLVMPHLASRCCTACTASCCMQSPLAAYRLVSAAYVQLSSLRGH